MTRVIFFLADSTEVRRAFIGWRRPVSKPQIKQKSHPFTGQSIHVKIWTIDPDDRDPRPDSFPGVTLGDRLGSLRHSFMRNVDPPALAALTQILLGGEFETCLDQIIEPPALLDPARVEEDRLCVLPDSLVHALRISEDGGLKSTAQRMSEMLPELTGGTWNLQDCARVVGELRNLAREAILANKRVYYYVFA